MFYAINSFIESVLDGRKSKFIKKNVTLKGRNYKFRRSSIVNFADGSSKDDIILGDHVWMYGILISS